MKFTLQTVIFALFATLASVVFAAPVSEINLDARSTDLAERSFDDEWAPLQLRDEDMMEARWEDDGELDLRSEDEPLYVREPETASIVERSFFKKLWHGIKKVGKKVVGGVKKVAGTAIGLVARHEDGIAARSVDEDASLAERSFFGKAWRGVKKAEKTAAAVLL